MTTRQKLLPFVTIGVLATALHTAIAASLITGPVTWSAGPANGLAFLVATSFSYVGNTLWTFSSSFSRDNARRFATTAVGGYCLAYLLATGAEALGWHYLIGIALIVVCVPALTFMVHNLWTYKK